MAASGLRVLPWLPSIQPTYGSTHGNTYGKSALPCHALQLTALRQHKARRR